MSHWLNLPLRLNAWLCLLFACVFSVVSHAGEPEEPAIDIDQRFPEYVAHEALEGRIASVGTDMLNELIVYWAQGFREYHPGAGFEIEGKGSSTAPPSLITGMANLGPMSREMKPVERDAFEKRFGYPPVQLPVAYDLVAVFVNQENPIQGLTLPQLDAIYSKTREQGYPDVIETWGDLGLEGAWADRRIVPYGRGIHSGAYGYFKTQVLADGEYSEKVKMQRNSSSVVRVLGVDMKGIGYSGIYYQSLGVRSVPLAYEKGGAFITAEHANASQYPLARKMFLALNHKPGTELDPFLADFIRYVYSQEGQQAALRAGFSPISFDVAQQALKQSGLDGLME